MKRRVYLVFALLLCMMAIAGGASATPIAQTNSSSNTAADSGNIIKVNLNTATADEFLAAIPGLGNRMVREFMEYRPYVSIQQFRQEIGKYVDDAQVAEYEKYVYVPIAINDSDSETLQQIPGLSADEAASLISARPFSSTEDFLTKLSGYISVDELEIAKTYLGGN